LGECFTAAGPVQHVLFQLLQTRSFPPPSSSQNELGASDAEELAKGDWPELQILDITWDGVIMLLLINIWHRARSMAWQGRHVFWT
jgi:hypothetical protein